MYQVTISPSHNADRKFTEVCNVTDIETARSMANAAVSEYFGVKNWDSTKEADADFVGCEDWFCYNPADKMKEACIVAINHLPLVPANSTGGMRVTLSGPSLNSEAGI